MPSRNLVLLAYHFLPHNTAGVQRAKRFYKFLPQFGNRPQVISSSHGGVVDGLDGVHWVPDEDTRAARRRSRLVDFVERAVVPYREHYAWAVHAVNAARRIHAARPIAALVSTSPPIGAHLAAHHMARRFGIPWLADFRDPLVGNPNRTRRFARSYDQFLERRIFARADAVVAVTDAVADDWRRRYPQWADKFAVVWNGFDPDEPFGPSPIPRRDHRLLLHAGVGYAQRHPFLLLDSLKRLRARGCPVVRQVRLRLLGPMADPERFRKHPAFEELVTSGSLEVVDDLVPRADAMREIATADGLLLLDIAQLSGDGYTVPAKTFDYVRTGRPILAVTARRSPVSRILAESGVPHVCVHHHDHPDTVDDKLLRYLALPSTPTGPDETFLERFDGRRQAESLARILDRITSVRSDPAGP